MTTKKRLQVVLLLAVTLAASSASGGSGSSNLLRRDGQKRNNNKEGGEWERMHVIRRLYGEQNANVRREVSKLEERMERYRTGLPGDPSHKVQYENHPYDKETRRNRRKLQDGDASTATTTDLFEPMRIKFFTEALDGVDDGANGAKIAWYKNQILPRTEEFWSRALSVVPVQGRLTVSESELDSRIFCGDAEFTAVPDSHKSDGVSDADVLLYVSGSNDARFCPERTLAVAVPCNFDQFDRPTAGAINVCLDNIELKDDGSASEGMVQDYVDVTIHEVGHVFAHSSNSYRFFW